MTRRCGEGGRCRASRRRGLSRGWGADEGSALVEFVFLGVVMLVPIVYLIVALARIQAGALAVEQGAREASRAFVSATGMSAGRARARAAAALAYDDQGFPAPEGRQLSVSCGGPSCLSAGAHVTVRAEITVVLPAVPRFLSDVIPVSVTLGATHVATVDEFGHR